MTYTRCCSSNNIPFVYPSFCPNNISCNNLGNFSTLPTIPLHPTNYYCNAYQCYIGVTDQDNSNFTLNLQQGEKVNVTKNTDGTYSFYYGNNKLNKFTIAQFAGFQQC